MANEQKLPQKWINTPFAFTRLNRNLSLIQQAVLVKVSEQLQPFIKEFFGSDLSKSRKVPKSLFSEAAKNSGVTQIYISYAELGVSENNYFAVKQAMKEVLDVKVEGPKKNEDGSWGMHMYNVFLSGETSIKNDGVVFSLNPQVIDPDKHLYVLDYAFNMTEGYVSHPDNIALIGEVARMPMMYYILRDASGNSWKERELNLTVIKIKTYLGMIEISNGEVLKEAYPKFSQFKKNVLETSIADINRLKKAGLLDVCISYEPIYNGKRKVGNPAFIKFRIYDTIEEMIKATNPQQTMLFAEEKPGEKEWQTLLSILKDPIVEYLKPLPLAMYDGKTIFVTATQDQVTELEKHLTQTSIAAIHECMKRTFCKVVDFNYRVAKKSPSL